MGIIILETLSNKKLIGFLIVALIVQIVFILIGGLISPSPDNVITLLGNICEDSVPNLDDWFARNQANCPRPLNDLAIKPEDWYTHIKNVNSSNGDHIVFSWKFPLPLSGHELSMSRYHQNFVALTKLSFHFFSIQKDSIIDLNMIIKIGGRNKKEKWTEIANSKVLKSFKCKSLNYSHENLDLECEMEPLFELGSVQYEEYLINIRLPSASNDKIGIPYDLYIYVIHPNGGFTFVWFGLKSFVFPILAIVLVWYIWKIFKLQRKPNVLERTLLAVGGAITLLNLPIDWLTLLINMPFMLLYSDIRQGLFYSVLLCFWVIFAGEHMMDQVKRNSLIYYWRQLTAVSCGCLFMFLFDICERGLKLTNPFFSMWETTIGSNIAMTFMILAAISAIIYAIYFIAIIIKVFRNIIAKRKILPAMSKPRQKYYKNLMYRFCFLMVFTILCASMTVVMYFIGQISEVSWKWQETSIQYTSAVQTGVYGMWNIYVFCLLILYAPSNRQLPISNELLPKEKSTEEQVEFTSLATEHSALNFIQKTSADFNEKQLQFAFY